MVSSISIAIAQGCSEKFGKDQPKLRGLKIGEFALGFPFSRYQLSALVPGISERNWQKATDSHMPRDRFLGRITEEPPNWKSSHAASCVHFAPARAHGLPVLGAARLGIRGAMSGPEREH